MPPTGAFRTTSKLVWSGVLLILATALFFLAATPLLTHLLMRGQDPIEIEMTFAMLLMFGLPGAWCAYAGIRSLLASGRVPREDEVAVAAIKPAKNPSKLITVGRNLFLGALVLGFVIPFLLFIWSNNQYEPGAESSEATLDTTVGIAFGIGIVMVMIAELGLILLVMGLLIRFVTQRDGVTNHRPLIVELKEKGKKERVILRAIGGVTILMAAFGLLYNFGSVPSILMNLEHEPDAPYVLPAYLFMSSICIGCYIALAHCGIQIVRLNTGVLNLFTGVLIFEVLYNFSIAALWFVPKIGMSVASATGIANGGLMLQFMILFPLWAPILAYWAARNTTGPAPMPQAQVVAGLPTEPP